MNGFDWTCEKTKLKMFPRVGINNFAGYSLLIKNISTTTMPYVIALLTNGENYTSLGERLGQLDRSLQDNYTASIIIFHEGYLTDRDIHLVSRHTQRKVTLRNVDKYFSSFPNGFDPYLEKPNWSKVSKWGYHHMINFWFKVVFDLPEIKNSEYMMRLDSDSRLGGNWGDIFQLMRRNNSVYMANFETLDYEYILPGTLKLKDLVNGHVHRKKIQIQNPDNFKRAFNNDSVRTYWNNFEIVRTEFFRQENVTDWVNTVVESHGIYKYRWGDAPLRYLTLAMFAKPEQVLHRVNLGLGYCHPC